ncbi:MAG: bifunctional aldolase/short-chain dehydrogenase [Magnetococcus sp. DMHC-6]
MNNRWNEQEAQNFIKNHPHCGVDLALRTYTSRLLGAEKGLVLHGGGNTSVKTDFINILGESHPAIYIKASGFDLETITPQGHCGLELAFLQRLIQRDQLDDVTMVSQLRARLLEPSGPTPSIETLVHCFLPGKFIDHTHADAILALSNRPNGTALLRQALGDGVIILPYVHPGFQLAKAVATAWQQTPQSRAMVLVKHGLITWGETAQESYQTTIELVSKAEQFLQHMPKMHTLPKWETPLSEAWGRYLTIAPRLRGALAVPSLNPDRPWHRMILQPLITEEVLALLASPQGREITLTPPLTADHLIRTKARPLWIDTPDQIETAICAYATEYQTWFASYKETITPPPTPYDPHPRVILMPGIGAICVGADIGSARTAKEITAQTLAVKAQIGSTGRYEGLEEADLFAMEYFPLQQAKLSLIPELPLRRQVAVVTGAAGTIGAGICQELLKQGCHVAATDISKTALEALVADLTPHHPQERILAVPMDVSQPEEVTRGFSQIISAWGGVDLVVINAGLAHVSKLMEMDPVVFDQLARVNINGTLNLLKESGRHFQIQATGGDIILISTKNVFAPGAGFGAYSASKAASHQLARIASLEMASLDVRVNMVAPDAVFGQGARRSGLWAAVGPDRMRARGLDEARLEEYYQKRNLLQAKITEHHVAHAVLFFATRQTPTTGVTLPVDGGLPDATPR